MKKVIIISLAFILFGCGAYEPAPTPVDLEQADYGSRPTKEDVTRLVDDIGHKTLKDPFSARYKYKVPRKAWTYYQFKVHYGYGIEYSVNSKNGFGAYGGYQDYKFLYINGNPVPAAYLNWVYDPEAQAEWEKEN